MNKVNDIMLPKCCGECRVLSIAHLTKVTTEALVVVPTMAAPQLGRPQAFQRAAQEVGMEVSVARLLVSSISCQRPMQLRWRQSPDSLQFIFRFGLMLTPAGRVASMASGLTKWLWPACSVRRAVEGHYVARLCASADKARLRGPLPLGDGEHACAKR